MHGGFPEDKELVTSVDGIDLLIAGHTHQVYREVYGDTIVSQAGSYGRYLGVLNLEYKDKKLNFRNTTDKNVVLIDHKIDLDRDYLKQIKKYRKNIDQLLAESKMQFDEDIFTSKKLYRREKKAQAPIGKFVATAIRKGLKKKGHKEIDVYFTSAGLIRKTIVKGETYQLSDIFKLMPIGFGENFSPGSPIVSFYLSKGDLRNLIRFTELYSNISANFAPIFSDQLTFRVRKWGIPFLNRIADLKLNGKDFDQWPTYINVSTSEFVSRYVDMVKKVTYDMVELVPRDKNGRPIETLVKGYGPEFLALANGLKED